MIVVYPDKVFLY